MTKNAFMSLDIIVTAIGAWQEGSFSTQNTHFKNMDG